MIDIIIPVFNALDDLKKCIESIEKNTNLLENRVLIYNDCSTDKRIWPYLQSVAQDNIKVFDNKKNLGFSGNINQGIHYSSDNDVILLNSDTVVTKDWVEKLRKCAYSDDNIATVTPLTNNATIFSVPVCDAENVVPDGFDIDSYADLIEKSSMHEYPQVPVAVGFCMYIKRKIFDLIGDFDAETFQRGYGEENDFCYRATQFGFCHVMCDDTYIYHSGSESFPSEEKMKYIYEHQKILAERYPKLVDLTTQYVIQKPNRRINDNIKCATVLANGRKNVLLLAQADFRSDAEDCVGGVQLHVKDLTDNLKKIFNIVVAARNGSFLDTTLYSDDFSFTFKFYVGDKPIYPQIENRRWADIYEKIIDSFNIDLIHVHHVIGLTFDIFDVAKKKKKPVFCTLHDFYYVCPNLKLLDANNEDCYGKTNENKCISCLTQKCGIRGGKNYINAWRNYTKKYLEKADLLIAPSLEAKEIYRKNFPELENIVVIEHGVNINLQGKSSITRNKSTLKVAFVGGLSIEKGAGLAYEIIKKADQKKYQFHVYGDIGYYPLRLLKQKNLIKHGRYERENLVRLLHEDEIDLICILPIWSETFCYTISEAECAGIPVLATDKGAVGRRVREDDCGFVMEEISSKNAIDMLAQIYENQDTLQEKKGHARIKSINEMISEYVTIYNRFFLKNSVKYSRLGWAFENTVVSNDSVVRNPYFSSRRYKIKYWLHNTNFPMKPLMKKVYHKTYIYRILTNRSNG